MASLTDRIFSALPAGDYCVPALMKVLEVVETERIPTASIECTDWPRLLVNPAFVARHANTPEKLLMLVLHELHHVILGHTRNVRRPGPLENLAFDMVINAMLSRSVRDPRARALLTDTYDPDQLPEALLRPPHGFRYSRERDRELAEAPLRWHAHAPPGLRGIYSRLYFGPGATYSEILDLLRGCARPDWGCGTLLLGGHCDDDVDPRPLARRSAVLHGALKSAVARWPQGDSPRGVATLNKALVVPAAVPPPLRGQLLTAIESVASPGNGFASGHEAPSTVDIESVIPRTSRRCVVGSALGVPPILYPEAVLGSPRPRESSPVHVYLDVSGSVRPIIPHLIGAILDAGMAVHPVVHQFSTQIADVSLTDLRLGTVSSAGGTDLECVAAHVASHRVRRAVIVTDGHCSEPTSVGAAALAMAHVAVVLTPGGSRRSLEGLIGHGRWFDLHVPDMAA